ncbi:MAG: Mpv17/PMP22 family protein [Verrucomicrobiaceae bacterium]|nr:Mpv17/PMP22 family protein [Verrucomicrobiaceae bacterium]
MPPDPPAPPGIRSAISAAFRQNRVPCILLNVLVVALVVSYYRVPAVAGLWEAVGAFKLGWSYAFSLASTIFAAAVMPFGVQSLMGTLRQEGKWRRLALTMLFWGYRGMEIDLFYRVQGWLFGHGNDARTLVIKVAVDQFLMSPLWFVPTYVIALRWIEHGRTWQELRRTLDRAFWTRTLPTVLVTNWIVWIPTLALVYSLPPALQFPLFSIVMCFFILVVTVMTRPAAAHKGTS